MQNSQSFQPCFGWIAHDEDAPERSQEHHVEEMSWDLSQSTVKLYRENREHSSDWLRTDGLISSANEKRVH